MNRNELCACGSGKRFKHCHGRLESAAGPTALHFEALAAHQSGSLRRAEALYARALEANPQDVDSLHMLGVLQFQRMRYRDALDLLWEAAERTGWADATVLQNLGLVLAKLLSPQANARQEALVAAYVARTRALEASPVIAARVSVVLPVYNAARVVARAIASVAAQTYKDIELIVVDDGSTDGTAEAIAACTSGLAIPVKVAGREHHGAAQAANDGADRAEGRYLAFLGAEDWFAPDRIERMVAAVARATPLWGFSQVGGVGDDSAGQTVRGSRPGEGASPSRRVLYDEPVSFTLQKRNATESSGNLFIERDLFRDLGGYPDVPRYRGWDFCVRAAEAVEPVMVGRHLYFRGKQDRAPGAVERRSATLVADALSGDTVVPNEFCPKYRGNRDVLLRSELRAGHGDRIPVPLLRSLAAEWRASPIELAPRHRDALSAGHAERTALIVLGMYRSGTSAFARTFNLCGAFLPDLVVASRLGLNPKGFWESEAVTDLDARLMEHLGADWNSVKFDLPRDGPLVDEFMENSRDVLATHYADAPFILIKDPRICLLAPLWHRALKAGEYRPVYAVTVRNPLEVARSIEAQGDMPVAVGMSLWLAYMQHVESFIDASGADVVHVAYTQLLDDWRAVVQTVARRLDVPLAIEPRAEEVDRFLEASMRNHRAADAELGAHLAGAQGEAVIALYRRLLERCERDAALPNGAAAHRD